MAQVHVYLPDELVEAARRAGVNVSVVTEAALRATLTDLAEKRTPDRADRDATGGVSPDAVRRAFSEIRGELDA